MKYLNAQQLAFILDIKKEDARVKMVNAWCRAKAIDNKLSRDHAGKIDKVTDNYPEGMLIEMLSKELNLPTLQISVDDIVNNYLTRPASKKWILCDYPEKQIAKSEITGESKKVILPAALKSMLPKETKDQITREWHARFSICPYCSKKFDKLEDHIEEWHSTQKEIVNG
jgi:hypothetical protein